MSAEQEDIVHRLRVFRNRRDGGNNYISFTNEDRTMLSEALAEIVELRGRVIQAERRSDAYVEELAKLAKVEVIKAERPGPIAEASTAPVARAARGRAIRIP